MLESCGTLRERRGVGFCKSWNTSWSSLQLSEVEVSCERASQHEHDLGHERPLSSEMVIVVLFQLCFVAGR
jgi:hypothetical protein